MGLELTAALGVDEGGHEILARFVARHTEGPHHLTFKVPDIRAAIERFRTSGFTPVNINLSDPEWQEAFILPRQAHGTVVQIAQSPHDTDRARKIGRAHV